MPVTLYYLDFYGRADVIRMLLHSQGIEFIDTYMSGEEVSKWGPTGVAEFHAVPALEIDNKSFIESRAKSTFWKEQVSAHRRLMSTT